MEAVQQLAKAKASHEGKDAIREAIADGEVGFLLPDGSRWGRVRPRCGHPRPPTMEAACPAERNRTPYGLGTRAP